MGAFGAIGGGAIGYAIITYFVISSKSYLPFALVLATIGVIFLITAILISSKKLYSPPPPPLQQQVLMFACNSQR